LINYVSLKGPSESVIIVDVAVKRYARLLIQVKPAIYDGYYRASWHPHVPEIIPCPDDPDRETLIPRRRRVVVLGHPRELRGIQESSRIIRMLTHRALLPAGDHIGADAARLLPRKYRS
jgi:hypothetical protein